MTKMLLNRC